MMATVLDVGTTSAAAAGLLRMTGDPRFAWDCRQRFIEGYATAVLGLDPAPFAAALAKVTGDESVASLGDLDGEAMERLAVAYQAVAARDDDWLEDPMRQLTGATRAVYALLDERARADVSTATKARTAARHGRDSAGHGVR